MMVIKSPATVPPEIVERIIDKVALLKDDCERFTALKACSLISRNFKNSSQRHLFQSLTIDLTSECDNHTTPAQIQNLHSAFFSSPNLPFYVQELHLLDLGNIQLSCEQILADIISMLKEVKILHINFQNCMRLIISFDWWKFTHTLQQALTTMLFSLPLTNLKLKHVSGFPQSTIQRFKFIPTVQLKAVEFTENETPGQQSGQMQPLIEESSLDIKFLTLEILDRWDLKPIIDTLSTHLGKLKKLTLDLCRSYFDEPTDWDFLKHCNSLTTLELLTRSILREYLEKIDLSLLPHLRSIKLSTDLAYEGEPSSILRNLEQCLRTASTKNEIKEIIFEASWDLYRVMMKPEPDKWKELDMMLSGPQFQTLEEVRFMVCSKFYHDALCRKMPMGALSENLSRTYERGIISVVEVEEKLFYHCMYRR
ncbi:hypothetical protein BDQ17DRAFT_1372576 [Cyathus striatus]|nr:hypothetical protein BDQ17DRAFT_1372576 [Cyathus striatus]